MRILPEISRLSAELESRQKVLGISREAFERARNSGLRRTQEKREMLRLLKERSEAAGVQPFLAYF